jgi:hypothetical protein
MRVGVKGGEEGTDLLGLEGDGYGCAGCLTGCACRSAWREV